MDKDTLTKLCLTVLAVGVAVVGTKYVPDLHDWAIGLAGAITGGVWVKRPGDTVDPYAKEYAALKDAAKKAEP